MTVGNTSNHDLCPLLVHIIHYRINEPTISRIPERIARYHERRDVAIFPTFEPVIRLNCTCYIHCAAMAQDAVKCLCLHCREYLFTCTNAWSRMSDEFHTFAFEQPPNIPGPELFVGQVTIQIADFPALDNRSLCCNNCTVLVGLQCFMAPQPKYQFKYV